MLATVLLSIAVVILCLAAPYGVAKLIDWLVFKRLDRERKLYDRRTSRIYKRP